MKVIIKRTDYQDKQTLGVLQIYDSGGALVKECLTLEKPWLDNRVRESCIVAGEYEVVKRSSPKYGKHFHILNVPGRSWILIHAGNYYTDTVGCVLVGDSFADLNSDGYKDVLNSRKTLDKMLAILPDKFELQIS